MSDITKIKVDGEPESRYQLYPRNEEFAKRSEGVQPDWNQNDDTKPDYVKNRPFYTGDPKEDVLFNGSFVFTIIGMGPMGERGVYNGVTDFSPEIGQTYQVSWDGAVYSCVGTEYNSLIALGNLSIMNFGSDTGEPFLMTFGTGSINIYTQSVGSSHTISIGKMVAPVVKIDPKYLVQPDWNQSDETQPDYVKNRPFYTGDPVETVLVEESTVSFSFSKNESLYMAQFSSTFSATVGEAYKVSWDGTVYECTCADFSGRTTIGNLSIMGAGSDTGEPFVMVVVNGRKITIGTADASASHTISISGYAESVVKIDQKYLPVASKTEPGIVSITPLSNAILQQVQHEYFIVRRTSVFGYGDAATIKMCADKNNSNGIFSSGEFDGAVLSCYDDTVNKYITFVLSGSEYINCYKFSMGSQSGEQLWGISKDGVVISSSTPDSTKKFKITVDDSGALTATEVT